MSAIRVLHLLPELIPGGAEQLTVDLACAQKQIGLQPELLLFARPSHDRLQRRLAEREIPLHVVTGPPLARLWRTATLLRRHPFDAIHTHLHAIYYGLACVVVPGVRWVHTVHQVVRSGSLNAETTVLRLALSAHLLRCVAVSDAAAAPIREWRLPCVVIENGVDLGRFRITEERNAWRAANGFTASDILCVCVARLRAVKNHALLVRAFQRVASVHPDSHLLLAGAILTDADAAIAQDISEYTHAHGLQHRVHLLGHRDDIPNLLGASDVFTLASSSEAHPVSILEAQECGLPAVCTAAGGVPAMIRHRIDGFLVPVGDETALAEALGSLLGDRELRKALGAGAKAASAARGHILATARSYADAYRACIRP